MSKSCRVPFCNMKVSMKKRCPGLSFHEFPADLLLREKWLKVIRRKDYIPHDTDCVCSVHFQPSDFKTGMKIVRLQPNAVPSIFPTFPKYLQPKNKPERRKIKRATPEVISSFKRSRKVKIKSSTCQNDAGSINYTSNLHSESGTQQVRFEPSDEVEYEVIPIDDSLQLLGTSFRETRTPTTKDVSTQASGMWDKIQELYKVIRKLRTELQKKTNEISSLTSQNKKLQKQLSVLKKQQETRANNERSLPSQFKKKIVKENVNIRKEDLNTYLHPRVPRSLCPPKNRNDTSQKVVLSVNHLNQITVSEDRKGPALNTNEMSFNNKDYTLFSRLNSVPKLLSENLNINHHELNFSNLPTPVTNGLPPKEDGDNKIRLVTEDTSVCAEIEKHTPTDSHDIPLPLREHLYCTTTVEPNMHENVSFPAQDLKENMVKCTELQTVENLKYIKEHSKYVLVPQNNINESHCDEIIICSYSLEDANHLTQQGMRKN